MLSDSTEVPSFKVIVETRRRLGGLGGGVLIVYAGALVLTPSWLSQRMDGLPKELRQTTPSVRWVRQPLFPPWLNRAVDFHPDTSDETIRLRFTSRTRKTLRAVLTSAGFAVVDVTSRSIFFGPSTPPLLNQAALARLRERTPRASGRPHA